MNGTGEGVRLAKRVAALQACSRREAEALIASGAVQVAGEVVTDPARRVAEDQPVQVSDGPVNVAMTVLLHKLCFDTFQHSAPGACLEASVRHVFFPVQAADLKAFLEHVTLKDLARAIRAQILSLERLKAKLAQAEGALREPIAIVGMGLRFPGGVVDLATFDGLSKLMRALRIISDFGPNRIQPAAPPQNAPAPPPPATLATIPPTEPSAACWEASPAGGGTPCS